jgi:hypothetical protein
MALFTDNCIVRAVTLAPNEPFNLPAGAEIISVTDINSLKSTCPIPNNLEELECYIIPIIAVPDRGNDNTYPYAGNENLNEGIYRINGMVVTGQNYPLNIAANEDGVFVLTQLASYIQSNASLSSLLLNVDVQTAWDDRLDPNGGVATICFRTVPSVAQDMFLSLGTSLVGVGVPEPDTYIRLYPIRRADYISNNGGNTPAGTCGCPATPVTT